MPHKKPTEDALHFADELRNALNGFAQDVCFAQDEVIVIARREKLLDALRILRDAPAFQFHQLIDITATDYPERADRFDVTYALLSMTHNRRLRVKVATDANTPVPSVTPLFSAATWFERETWDMYGVYFDGNPDHRRILTDYGFDGHPLRKDFPLTGFVEVRYDSETARVVYEPTKFPQDFRPFDFESPWEGMTNVQLPGDEKGMKPKFGTKDYKTEQRGGA